MHRILPQVNGAFSAGAFGVRQNLERCSRLMNDMLRLWR
jgi:hypothetical protein